MTVHNHKLFAPEVVKRSFVKKSGLLKTNMIGTFIKVLKVHQVMWWFRKTNSRTQSDDVVTDMP